MPKRKCSYHFSSFVTLLLFLVVIYPFIYSCSTQIRILSQTDIQGQYSKAVDDAEIAEPAEISNNLTAIVAYNKNLVWQGQPGMSKVLVLTWTDWAGYDNRIGQSMKLQRSVWVTPVPELKNFCKNQNLSREGLILRLEQLLGLPPNNGKTKFVELWVDPDDLFRPSPDPEISDHEAELDFPKSSKFLTVSESHIKWFNDLKSKSYGQNGFPWTRLGYTYDWGNPKSEVGLSEFVIKDAASVEVESVSPIDKYCR